MIFHNQSHDTVPTRVALPSNFGDKVTTSHQSTLISSSNLKITNKNDRYYMKWIVVEVAINVLHANRACNCVQWDDILSWGLFVKLRHYEKATKFWKNIPPLLTRQLFLLKLFTQTFYLASNKVGDFFKILWPFQESWTLTLKFRYSEKTTKISFNV